MGALALTMNARSLNLLMLGERDAFDLGVEVGRVRIVVFVVASLLVGSSVASEWVRWIRGTRRSAPRAAFARK